jgi:hypothetical protein
VAIIIFIPSSIPSLLCKGRYRWIFLLLSLAGRRPKSDIHTS